MYKKVAKTLIIMTVIAVIAAITMGLAGDCNMAIDGVGSWNMPLLGS